MVPQKSTANNKISYNTFFKQILSCFILPFVADTLAGIEKTYVRQYGQERRACDPPCRGGLYCCPNNECQRHPSHC